MSHLALYRKYRSQTFEDLVGQDHITQTIQAAIKNGKPAHAYLFTGPRGTGKTSSARILAKALNCDSGPTPTPCGECPMCLSISQGSCVDVIEMDAASESGVDEVRQLIESAQYAPMSARYKVYVIDEVHDLSQKAFDALLKTIEEPPAHVVFVLATTAYNKVPLTIRSRCQKYEFHRGSLQQLVSRLQFVCDQEGVEAEEAALIAIARMADGGYRDALTLLEQAIVTQEQNLTLKSVTEQLGLIDKEETDKLIEAAIAGDSLELVRNADQIVRQGKEPRAVLESMLLRLSELTHTLAGLEDGLDPQVRAADHALASRIGQSELLRMRTHLAEAHKDIRDVTLPRLWLELALLKLAQPPAQQEKVQRPSAQSAAPSKPAAKPIVSKSLPGVSEDAAEVWSRVIEEITSKYTAAGKMLEGAFLSNVEGKVAVISFAQRFQYERATKPAPSGKKSIQEILVGAFRQHMKDDSWTLRFQLSSEASQTTEAAVQLPVEGEELAKLVEDVFEVSSETK